MLKETTLGISLYSSLYLKLAKMLCLSYYLLCFLFTEQVLPGTRRVGKGGMVCGKGERWFKQCIHI
jgi:hypothetical protein